LPGPFVVVPVFSLSGTGYSSRVGIPFDASGLSNVSIFGTGSGPTLEGCPENHAPTDTGFPQSGSWAEELRLWRPEPGPNFVFHRNSTEFRDNSKSGRRKSNVTGGNHCLRTSMAFKRSGVRLPLPPPRNLITIRWIAACFDSLASLLKAGGNEMATKSTVIFLPSLPIAG